MTHPIDLYELMPAVHRREDAGLAYPLEALLDIISTEAGHLQRDIAGLWDDFFIETASEWVIPYIADLVGSTPLHRVTGSWRADVAGTISYRRRKGTLIMLEELAAAVTGWGARVVPFFEELEWAQHLDHLRRTPATMPGRLDRVGTVNIGNVDAMDRLGDPFDDVVRSVDIRPFGAGRGRHNIKKIGFFLWRLRSNPLTGVEPVPAAGHPHGYHLSPLGNSAPIFTNDRRQPGGRPTEIDLPGPIRRLALLSDVEAAAAAGQATSRYYGPDTERSLVVAVGSPIGTLADQAIPASRVTVCNLSTWRLPPAGKDVAIDPLLGRMTLAPSAEPGGDETVRIGYCYGFSGGPGADLGGGPYDREPSTARRLPSGSVDRTFRRVVASVDPGTGPWSSSVGGAIDDWLLVSPPPERAVIEIIDSGTYHEGSLDIALPRDAALEIRSADRQRPVLDVTGLTVHGAGGGTLRLDGLAVVGSPLRIGDGMAGVTIRHATLVPGQSFDAEGVAEHPSAASIVATTDASGCPVTLTNAIVGPIRLPAEGWSLIASDSIIDSPADETAIGGAAGDHGPACDLRWVTVLGDVRVRSILYASDVLFLDRVEVQRTQAGCIRFSYVRDTATTPRRYRCQPDLALADAAPAQGAAIRSRLRPRFTSRQYGQPGYGQLAVDAAEEIKTGGAGSPPPGPERRRPEGEAEMGAFSRALEAQRTANLQIRLDEYLPAGFEPGLIFVT
ncbi:MAG TPA: hypothetical protein VFR14_11195 [Candidatus Limnocylindrales bacterium]|nr:hypothetical protein [Candidatus Limnocylindrales bacterium]